MVQCPEASPLLIVVPATATPPWPAMVRLPKVVSTVDGAEEAPPLDIA